MKVRTIIIAIASSLALFSCGTVKSVTDKITGNSENSVDYYNGNTAAISLTKLASSLQSGSLDLSNSQNILSIASLVPTLSSLKSGNNASIEDFTKGLVAGSKNLITSANSGTIVKSLLKLAENMDLDRVADLLQKGKNTANEVLEFKDQMEEVLALIKK